MTRTYLDGVLIADDRTLEDAQTEALNRLAAEFSQAVAAGMPWAGRVLQIDDEARGNMTSMVLASQLGLLPADFAWRMADNSFLPLNAQGLQRMVAAALATYFDLRRRHWAARDAARAATTRQAADAVEF